MEQWRSNEAVRSRPARGRRNISPAVRVDPLFQAPDPARVSGSSVTFEPGARTAWHTHPLGQTLMVTSGFAITESLNGEDESADAKTR